MTATVFGAVVYARDPERVAEFYSRVACLALARREETFVQLRAGAIELVVHRIPPPIAAGIHVAEPPRRREDAAVKLVFAVDSIAAARAGAAALGGVIDPVEREWTFDGLTICDGHDPEGNVIQLRQRLA
jgi:predicted enzyme related to lactoylglutathione lyase